MTPRRIECPRCHKLLGRVDGWGVTVESKNGRAHFEVGSLACRRCDVMVSFQDRPREAEQKSLR